MEEFGKLCGSQSFPPTPPNHPLSHPANKPHMMDGVNTCKHISKGLHRFGWMPAPSPKFAGK